MLLTAYVHDLQAVNMKQAVACPPQLFVAVASNLDNPSAADCHSSVCLKYMVKLWLAMWNCTNICTSVGYFSKYFTACI